MLTSRVVLEHREDRIVVDDVWFRRDHGHILHTPQRFQNVIRYTTRRDAHNVGDFKSETSRADHLGSTRYVPLAPLHNVARLIMHTVGV